MPSLLKDKKLSTLVLAILLGIVLGSYFNLIFQLLPDGNVVKDFFTYNFINFGIGDFENGNPVLIDLAAIKFQFGFHIKLSFMSFIGVLISLYTLRWYR